MIAYEYPFYLVNGVPFMKVGKYQAAVYWGAQFSYGDLPPFEFAGREESLMGLDDEELARPDFFTEHCHTYTDFIAGWLFFISHDFTIDLANERICIHFADPGCGNMVELYEDHDNLIPMVLGKIDGKEYLFQVDVGDKFSIVSPEALKGKKPSYKGDIYVYEHDKIPTKTDIYEVPIQLSDKVTINAHVRSIGDREFDDFFVAGSHGSIGVDLIKEHTVSFMTHGGKDVMFFNPFN